MALTKFVRNVDDLSDDGGFKFRFKCDRCRDGFESHYIAAKSNLLKTALDMFEMFRPLGFGRASKYIDRGLRGKERDAAYERAVNEAAVFFKKCTACGQWVCPEACWNAGFNLCEVCAPNAMETSAKQSAKLANQKAMEAVMAQENTSLSILLCPSCGQQCAEGKFCPSCGTPIKAETRCASCQQLVDPSAKFCSLCGAKR